jgi:two-component system, LuxR family, sensor kinase FixL
MIRWCMDRVSGRVGEEFTLRHRFSTALAQTNMNVQSGPGVATWARNLTRHLRSGPLLAAILVSVGYYLGAKLGFALTLQPQPVSILWPPNAILFAVLLLTPPRTWWFLFLAAFPAHWATQFQSNVPIPMMLCWFVSNSFEALLGASLSRYLVRGPFRFDSLRALGVFMACGVFLAPFVSSFLDAGFVALNGWGQSGYWDVWRTRFFSNAMAALTLGTVIVSWTTTRIDSIWKATEARRVEAILLIAGVFAVGFSVFVLPDAGPGRRPILLYAPLPFLLWAAVRFGFTGLSTSILAVVLLAIWGTAHGQGPFSSRTPLENALSVQIFLTVVSIPLFCLSAVLQERRKTEEALRRSEARYREVVETQTDLICRFLPDTTLTFVNEAYCRFFNRERDFLIGRKFVDLIPEAAQGKALEHIASLLNNLRIEAIEHEVLLPDGTLVWQQWVNHAIRGPDGRVIEFQAIGRDITDRKRAEEAQEKLTHVSRLAIVGELTASIVHEISQPLGAILSNAEAAGILLEAAPGNIEDVRHILADIRKDDVRASEVIRHIRNLLHKRQFEMQPVDVNKLVLETLGFISIEAHRRRIICETQFAPGLPNVAGDSIQLQQVLLNLALNGMDAMARTAREHKRLLLRTRSGASGDVEVVVRDAGSGIPPGRLPKLFESFFSTKEDGMGLGLSISKAIIEAHRGRIWGENNLDEGATFGFALSPIEPDAAKINVCQPVHKQE